MEPKKGDLDRLLSLTMVSKSSNWLSKEPSNTFTNPRPRFKVQGLPKPQK